MGVQEEDEDKDEDEDEGVGIQEEEEEGGRSSIKSKSGSGGGEACGWREGRRREIQISNFEIVAPSFDGLKSERWWAHLWAELWA